MKMYLKYVVGDATEPVKKPAVITHVCNDTKGWGKGFVVPLGRKYPEAKQSYLTEAEMVLGETQFVEISEDIVVANMISQHGLWSMQGVPPIRYPSLRKCLEEVYLYAIQHAMTVHMPRIASGLAGGDWGTVEAILHQCMMVDTYVYTLPSETKKFTVHDQVVEIQI